MGHVEEPEGPPAPLSPSPGTSHTLGLGGRLRRSGGVAFDEPAGPTLELLVLVDAADREFADTPRRCRRNIDVDGTRSTGVEEAGAAAQSVEFKKISVETCVDGEFVQHDRIIDQATVDPHGGGERAVVSKRELGLVQVNELEEFERAASIRCPGWLVEVDADVAALGLELIEQAVIGTAGTNRPTRRWYVGVEFVTADMNDDALISYPLAVSAPEVGPGAEVVGPRRDDERGAVAVGLRAVIAVVHSDRA